MFSNIQGWIDVLSGIATILALPISLLALRRAGSRSRVAERKVRLRLGKIEWISIRKDGDHSL